MKVFRIEYVVDGVKHTRVLQAKDDEAAIDIVMTDWPTAKIESVR